MNRQLENKRALVTGGSRGIGAAIVLRLAREGAHVALTYHRESSKADEIVTATHESGVKALALPRYASGDEIASLVAYLASPERDRGQPDYRWRVQRLKRMGLIPVQWHPSLSRSSPAAATTLPWPLRGFIFCIRI
jgi:short chain dehydrogenase